jgi:hypothetical protein
MMEHIEIEGRRATVIYLSDDFQPVDKDYATRIKVRFDDGEIRFGELAEPE